MMWIPLVLPSLDYKGHYQCRRQCEQALESTVFSNSISSPYTFTSLNPGSYCIVGLKGIYGSEEFDLARYITTTHSSGKL